MRRFIACALGFVVVAAIFVAYRPAWFAGFIWDDDLYVTRNLLLTAPDGLRRIWFSTDSPSQYFPLVYTTFWLERALWGLNAPGYHLVNIGLHAINALLVWSLLKRLRVPGAWLAAAIFGLHPVNVESVAWVTELKNIQSLFFSLLALHAWLSFLHSWTARVPAGRHGDTGEIDVDFPAISNRPGGTRALDREDASSGARWIFYALALIGYVLALFSKTTACTLPAALLVVAWLAERPLNRPLFLRVMPFVVLGAAFGLLTMWWERFHQGTSAHEFTYTLLDRVLIASRSAWFSLGKLLWPADLTFIYPLWKIDASALSAYFGLAAAAIVGVGLWWVRKFKAARATSGALLFYVATLAPTSGLIMLYTFHFALVADHYQYVASLGPIALIAAGAASFADRWTIRLAWRFALSGAVLLTLAALTWRQSGMYQNLETLWRAMLARDPQSYIAHNSLSLLCLQRGNLDEGLVHAERAVELQRDPTNHALALLNRGTALLRKGRVEDAVADFQRASTLAPELADAPNNLGSALLAQGRVDDAIRSFERALEIQPRLASAHYNLGSVLFQRGQLLAAAAHLQAAIAGEPENVDARLNLGVALLMLGRSDDARAQFEAILQIQPQSVAALSNLGFIAARSGERRAAIQRYRSALALDGENLGALNGLAWLLATASEQELRDGPSAVALATRANTLSAGQNAEILRTLAAAYAEAGQFEDAARNASSALTLARASARSGLVTKLENELSRYAANQPLVEVMP